MQPEEKPSLSVGQLKETFRISSRLMKLVWGIDKWLVVGSIVAVLIPAVVPFINIYIYKLVIDQVVKVVAGATFNPSVFYPLLLLRVVTYFIQDVAFRTQNLMERLLWTKVPIELNQMILRKISSLDIIYFENDKFRDLLEKVRESGEVRPQQLMGNILFFFQSGLQLIIAFVALARLNWILVFLIAFVSIPGFINESHYSKLSWGLWGKHSPLSKKFGYLKHLIQHHREVKEIKIFSLAEKFLNETRQLQEEFYVGNKELVQKAYKSGLLVNVLSTGVFVGIEIYVIFQALARKVTIGDINFYTGVVSNFQNGLGGALRTANNIFENSLYLKSVFEVLDIEPIIQQKADSIKLPENKTPKIEFKNVSFTYPDTKNQVLKDFSIEILPGQKIAFVGENGAGKSTIIKLLARFYEVDKGEILINGTNIKDIDLESWYKHIGVLFQEFNRYEYSVAQNIYFGKVHEPYSDEQIVKAATSAGAHEMIKELDKGYEQMLGRMFEGGVELSGGQWQKVALARAFLRNAPILVLDEPTSSIDAKAESEIFNRVEKLSKDKTVIIISHRFSTVRNADKIYVIENGKIIEEGSHKELIAKKGVYQNLFELQAKGYRD